MKLNELVDPALLAEMVDGGYIRTQVHPDLPLTIYNYSEKAQFDRVWNEATRQCRGLIVDDEGVVVARPFRKFMNSDEPGVDPIGDEPVCVTDKKDGSLGIAYWAGDGFRIATRGSFASEQALHATKVWQERYSGYTEPFGLTMLFEIIYPENRIVVDNGTTDDLVLLSAVDIETGRSYTPQDAAKHVSWEGPIVETFPYSSLMDALAAEPRDNAEGLVVHGLQSDNRQKIKYERYKYLHKLVTGMNERVVWERLGEGEVVEDLIVDLPDEFHPWVVGVAERLREESDELIFTAQDDFEDVINSLGRPDWTRKDFAMVAKNMSNCGYLFLLLDDQHDRLVRTVWRDIRPSGAVSMTGTSEDVA